MEAAPQTPARWVPFAYGFRPFFLGALLFAMVSIASWIWVRASGALPLYSLPPALWHGHEMLFGFAGAAIAGFLLTAVPSWTGARGFAGAPLVAAFALWLLGRIAFAFAAHLPVTMLAWGELLFIPAVMVLIAPPLLRARNRNTPLLLILLLFWGIDATFLCALALGDLALASKMLLVGIDLVLVLITLIGGRIVPTFTANALRKRGILVEVRTHKPVDIATIGAMVGVLIVDGLQPDPWIVGFIAGIAAILHLVRLAGWQGRHTVKEPIVWVLHVAYLWLPAGLMLKAASLGLAVPWASQWLHALTIGAVASMIVAVITRAALGHTGRPLEVARGVGVAYVVLSVAALLRVLVDAAGLEREWMVRLSSGMWFVAFAILLIGYAPILLRARVDGKPG